MAKGNTASHHKLVQAITDNPDLNQAQVKAGLREAGYTITQTAMGKAWAEVRGAGAGAGSKRPSYRRNSRSRPLGSIEEGVPLCDPATAHEAEKPVAGGSLPSPDEGRRRLAGRRFFFTAAQNNTYLHSDLWDSIQHFCRVNKVQLGVSRITYNKNAWQRQSGVTTESAEVWYDDRLRPYFLDEQVKVASGLVFCGELDILASASNPLSGLDNYAGHNSAIIPHTKMQMQSLATMKFEPTKFLYTTGTCTLRNYIDRKAGQLASYHHVYGGMYVEIAEDGSWFARQINADDNGWFYDLDRVYGPGWDKPASEMGAPMVNLGDIHIEKVDTNQLHGALDMMDALQPKAIFLHDLIDFSARNHHNKRDPYFLHAQHFQADPVVENGIKLAAQFLYGTQNRYPDATLYVIRSNHDCAFEKWLKEGTPYPDPCNMRYWHECNARMLRAVEQDEAFDVFAWALQQAARNQGYQIDSIKFVQEDESLLFLGIEFGMHGHLGPNGSRGSPKSFRQIGRKANTGHTHSASILDGIWTAGVLGSLDMGYNKGPSSWSCSHILTYPNGKRSIVTQRGNQWRA